MLEPGITLERSVTVSKDNTASTVGSGELDVFATPAMAALMEETAWRSIAPHLEKGQGSVGASLNLTHDAPSPIGATITCQSELIAVEGRKLTFKITCSDETGMIGQSEHVRYMIDNERFIEKAKARL